MKLSILDQSPIFYGETEGDALQSSKELAVLADRLGYTRYWVTEHHDLEHVACPAPEVLLSYIGAHTKQIRLGAGAILLPHYQPYKVVEVFNTLATLFPDRIDLGLGRAPGGSAEATTALSPRFLEEVRKMPEKVEELLHFLHHDFPKDHLFHNVQAKPIPNHRPEPWLLGTGKKSALLAAQQNLSYAFGYFMSDHDGKELFNTYRTNFVGDQPYTLLAVSVICSETESRAQELAHWTQVNNEARKKGDQTLLSVEEAKCVSLPNESNSKLISGTFKTVKKKLMNLEKEYEPDELMITTITPNREERLTSYQLLSEAIQQK
ncbi:LLM class flavin-dependent oxidoreductase [Pseudalkalibacillus hwajinpoensis]|uniref:LLM class flavin-dependent oxidoreductase n=1 Tax=Guptibacillus hwajinpoensis TaxID=208199 RepID=UPI001CD80181|nr:LLM class flavin-dependent oxidoreductase [Pseudalkalibacillus hwajinpoensis]MCA0990525.1 LLM class flavin-dependent oxidoreductase [Pseudalkalibacillus hwajinpoensis]